MYEINLVTKKLQTRVYILSDCSLCNFLLMIKDNKKKRDHDLYGIKLGTTSQATPGSYKMLPLKVEYARSNEMKLRT